MKMMMNRLSKQNNNQSRALKIYTYLWSALTASKRKSTLSIHYIVPLWLFLSFMLSTHLIGQDKGYLALPDSLNYQISINDSVIVYSPDSQMVIALQTGEHILKISPINDKSWYTMPGILPVYIHSAETLTVDYSQIISLKYENTNFHTINLHQNNIEYQPVKESFFQENLKPGLIITAIAANWAAFYLKREADDFYSEYQHTSSVSQMNYYYDKAADFDRYSTIMLGVSLAALSAYLYMLLSE